MIRQVELQDAKAITNIYNEYVLQSVATFDTEPVLEEEMRTRIAEISSRFPYFVYEENQEITGYCYAHTWKERWKRLFICLPDTPEKESGCS